MLKGRDRALPAEGDMPQRTRRPIRGGPTSLEGRHPSTVPASRRRTSRHTATRCEPSTVSTDGWQFSGDVVRFCRAGPRCVAHAGPVCRIQVGQRRSRQMVPAFDERRVLSHRGRHGVATALGRCTKPAGGR
jgi:hypothetical protein